jgi:hypothetical protein
MVVVLQQLGGICGIVFYPFSAVVHTFLRMEDSKHAAD